MKHIKLVQTGGFCNIEISVRIMWHGHVERMHKQVATARVEGRRKRKRPCSRWRDVVVEDLKYNGSKQ